MNYFTLFPLSGYWSKFVGLTISAIALIILAIYKLAGPAYLPLDLPPIKLMVSILWVFAFGLYILTLSKEKVDDERVKQIRYTALKGLAYFSCVGPLIAFVPFALDANGLSEAVTQDPIWFISCSMVLPLLIYQIVFNIGLYLNPQWIFNDLSAEENVRKNPKFFIIYTIFFIIFLIGFTILNR